MKVEIITPDTLIFEGEASSLTLPGSDGSFGVLENHAAMVADLTKGTVEVQASGKNESFEINGGTVEIQNNNVTILAI